MKHLYTIDKAWSDILVAINVINDIIDALSIYENLQNCGKQCEEHESCSVNSDDEWEECDVHNPCHCFVDTEHTSEEIEIPEDLG